MEQEKKRVEVEGVALAYTDQGDGFPIVFLHGFPSSSFSWNWVVPSIVRNYRCICFDLMGFGDSDKPVDECFGIERQSHIILGALQELGLSRVFLVGHSFGGGVCLEIMRQLGPGQDLVTGLSLIDAVCYRQPLPWFIWMLKIPFVPKLIMAIIPEKWGFGLLKGMMYHRSTGMRSEAIHEYARHLQSPGGHKAIVCVAKQILPEDIGAFIASYSQISVPTLIVWGCRDKVIPIGLGRRLADDINGCLFHEIGLCGHVPQEEYPDLVAELLLRFVGSVRKAQD